MNKKIIKFAGTEIKEYEFLHYKSPIPINNIEIDKIVVSNKFPFGKQKFRYSIGHKDNRKLYLYAHSFQKWVYIKDSDETECMYFMIKDGKVFDKFITIW